MTKEEVLNKHKLSVSAHPSTRQALAAMDEYAKQEAIAFVLDFVGGLSFPEGATNYDKGSNEDILIHLPATIEKRYELYLKLKNEAQ